MMTSKREIQITKTLSVLVDVTGAELSPNVLVEIHGRTSQPRCFVKELSRKDVEVLASALRHALGNKLPDWVESQPRAFVPRCQVCMEKHTPHCEVKP